MSIDLNWETVTGGPDGQELALRIRDFIHTKFQSVPLPRFIKSVTVHDFQFGTIPPEVELKDITDPLPDFYEENLDSDFASDSESDEDNAESLAGSQTLDGRRRRHAQELDARGGRNSTAIPPHLSLGHLPGPGNISRNGHDTGTPFLRVSTPGIPGVTSNMHYFHSQFAPGLSGTQTPLAAVAGAHHFNHHHSSWLEGHGHSSSAPNLRQQYIHPPQGAQPIHHRNPSQSSISIADFSPTVPAATNLPPPSPTVLSIPALREKHSVSTLAANSAPNSAGASRPPTRDAATQMMMSSGSAIVDDDEPPLPNKSSPKIVPNPSPSPNSSSEEGEERGHRLREKRIEDLQAVFRIKYAGDIKLLLTADILLDYPMPSFVGIPVRLSITGLTFDGVGVLANIRKRVHFCFLSPEDAVAAVGSDGQQNQGGGNVEAGGGANTKLGGLLQEIRVESEIGQRESGKQSLKNVGKVERFVLEQVRRIFEEEFVYPSFWTFLV
ncbi:hypothetical protein QBC38DRAFT_474593 [Podospora fimiseda]|uniref:Mitochondrial distribution and morphology protein 12 n=1 Tax=Podospora fimiseda TaxID=252190 RepID=A0AAN7BRT7_9PEZI|nr:hypothetical protein QBC38DRAFT_474593 [Podospora fimiseda]